MEKPVNVLVIDGQGGGMGRAIVERLKAALPGPRVVAVGTNALATAAMLRAGADAGATGENAVRVNAAEADVLLGPIGLLLPDAMLGEITAGMAHAVASSPAQKFLLPVDRSTLRVVGVRPQSLESAVREMVQLVAEALRPPS
jgi:NAD(P)-dependent dehydrogenase (short-subunit alcohol dehydrogenase family)